jgi:hypothetical protein
MGNPIYKFGFKKLKVFLNIWLLFNTSQYWYLEDERKHRTIQEFKTVLVILRQKYFIGLSLAGLPSSPATLLFNFLTSEIRKVHSLMTSRLNIRFQVIAIYDFEAEPGVGELAMVVGDILTVTRTDVGEGWWEGQNARGEIGLFPEAYVEVKS